MWISFRKSQELQAPEPFRIRNREIERVKVFKLLGVPVQSDLKWIAHIDEIVARASKRLYFLRVCRKANLPTEVGLTTYITRIRPLLEYASPIWGGILNYLAQDIQRIQDRSMDILGLARETLETVLGGINKQGRLLRTFQSLPTTNVEDLLKTFCIHIILDLNGYEYLYHAQIGVGNHLYSAGRECKQHNRLFFSFVQYLYFYCKFDVILMQKSNIKVIIITDLTSPMRRLQRRADWERSINSNPFSAFICTLDLTEKIINIISFTYTLFEKDIFC